MIEYDTRKGRKTETENDNSYTAVKNDNTQ